MGIMSLLKYRLEKSDISIEKVIFLSHISYKINFMWVKNIKIQNETEKRAIENFTKLQKVSQNFRVEKNLSI